MSILSLENYDNYENATLYWLPFWRFHRIPFASNRSDPRSLLSVSSGSPPHRRYLLRSSSLTSSPSSSSAHLIFFFFPASASSLFFFFPHLLRLHLDVDRLGFTDGLTLMQMDPQIPLGFADRLTLMQIDPPIPLVGAEAENDRIELLLSELKGKDVTEIIAAGREKLASVPSGGGVAVAVSAGAGGGGAEAPAAAEQKKEEKVEEKEKSDDDMGFSLFD